MIEALGPLADGIILTRPVYERSAEPRDLAAVAAEAGYEHRVEGDLMAALALARGEASDRDMVVVTGSLFVVGEILERLGIKPFEEEIE